MRININRKSKTPIFDQLKSAIQYEVSFGILPNGARLPSIRDLAEQAGVAPMTVSKVYAELKAEGLIHSLTGSGTFVAETVPVRTADEASFQQLSAEIDSVLDFALKSGFQAADIRKLVSARVTLRLGAGYRKNIMMVGLFADATVSYANSIEEQIGHLATVESTTTDALRADTALLARAESADLILTFGTLRDEVEQLVTGVQVISLQFIPSGASRRALASLDPMVKVALVSRFHDFLPILSLGVRRFAAHVQNVTALNIDDPDLASVLNDCDVLVLATGADEAAQHARPGTLKIEYRHIPDPGDVDRLVIPFVTNADLPNAGSRKEAL